MFCIIITSLAVYKFAFGQIYLFKQTFFVIFLHGNRAVLFCAVSELGHVEVSF